MQPVIFLDKYIQANLLSIWKNKHATERLVVVIFPSIRAAELYLQAPSSTRTVAAHAAVSVHAPRDRSDIDHTIPDMNADKLDAGLGVYVIVDGVVSPVGGCVVYGCR